MSNRPPLSSMYVLLICNYDSQITNFKALISKGFIKAENFATSTNKKQYRYLLTREGIEEKVVLTEKFIKRKKQEYEELQIELVRMREVDHG